MHAGSATRLSGKLLVVSGRDGRVVQQATVPDGQESYYSPVIYRRKDESRVVLFGTGGETHAGSLWVVELKDLLAGKIDRVSGSLLMIITYSLQRGIICQ